MPRLSPPLRASPIGLPSDVALYPTLDGPWTHHFAEIGDVRMHYVLAGEGPLVVLLHGFPDFWLGWRRQIEVLARAGFRVVVPDLRGYNLSDKPRGLAAYATDKLVGDVIGLMSHLGAETASIVGHDWGGVIAWSVARRRPEKVDKLVVLNAPHPGAYVEALRGTTQILRSWYVFAFAVPWIPEWILGARHAALIGRVFRNGPTRAGAFSEEEIAAYRDASSRPGALTGMINYYRARFLSMLTPGWKQTVESIASAVRGERTTLGRPSRITRPTLVIWGEKDRYLDNSLLDKLDRWVSDVKIVRLPNASHWVMADAPSEVNRALVDFLVRQEPPGPVTNAR